MQRFYRSELRLFAGDDLNLAIDDLTTRWPGIGRYVPAKSTVLSLPFRTNFNAGHGLVKANQGKVEQREWHDVSQQDVLPTWQFAVFGDQSTSVFYDFDNVFHGGSSLAIRTVENSEGSRIPLYQTSLLLESDSSIEVIFKHLTMGQQIEVVLTTVEGRKVRLPLDGKAHIWQSKYLALGKYAGDTISRIAVHVKGGTQLPLATNIGQLELN